MRNFHSLDVVGRGSEAQLQVGENFDKITVNLLSRDRAPFVSKLFCHFEQHIKLYINYVFFMDFYL